MKIEEYLGTLPENLVSGQDVLLDGQSLEEIFELAGMGAGDVFYHLGCGDETGVRIASERFKVRKAVGIDNNEEKISNARGSIIKNAEFRCQDIRDAEMGDATIILFWFADEEITDKMAEKFKKLRCGTRVMTIWAPLPGCLPDKVSFPYIVNKAPFREAHTLQEQLQSVFGTECIDFVTAWEHAERYAKAVSRVKNDRFLTIIQTLVIWINARNLGVACEDGVPESIKTYIGIMKEHFGIDFEHLL